MIQDVEYAVRPKLPWAELDAENIVCDSPLGARCFSSFLSVQSGKSLDGRPIPTLGIRSFHSQSCGRMSWRLCRCKTAAKRPPSSSSPTNLFMTNTKLLGRGGASCGVPCVEPWKGLASRDWGSIVMDEPRRMSHNDLQPSTTHGFLYTACFPQALSLHHNVLCTEGMCYAFCS